MLEALISFFFGPPIAIFCARVLATLALLCPCPPGDAGACEAQHRAAAETIAVAAWESSNPDEAAALLLGIGAHETGFRTLVQAKGGPAVSWWQLEVPRAERAALLASPLAAARRALRIARGCRGSLRGYATGRCDGGGEEGAQKAAELRALVRRARRIFITR